MRVLAAFLLNVVFNFAVGLLVAKFLGPAEYGRFALSLATAMAVQTAFLDWLRLGATRFYSERSRGEDPALRATLDVAFALITCGLAVGAACLFMTGVQFPLSNGLIALAMGAAVSNGLFDYNTALVRARFHDTLYVKLVIVKNILALSLTGTGAFYFGSAKMALIGSVISLSGSVVAARAALSDPGAEAHLARFKIARSILRYALPIVTSNLLYLSIPLANRSLIAILYGFSETGQFSLAFDIGTKAVQAIGSTLDVLLFQIAVRAHDSHGADHAKQRIGDNMAIVIAVILPACCGIWLVLPSMQALIVPQQYRGPFEQLLTLMMPGLFWLRDDPLRHQPDLPDRQAHGAADRRGHRRLPRRADPALPAATQPRRFEPRHRPVRRLRRRARDARCDRRPVEARVAANPRHRADGAGGGDHGGRPAAVAGEHAGRADAAGPDQRRHRRLWRVRRHLRHRGAANPDRRPARPRRHALQAELTGRRINSAAQPSISRRATRTRPCVR